MLFEQVGKFPDQLAAFARRHAAPRAIEGLPGRLHGAINVGAVAFSYSRQHLAGRGIVGVESLAAGSIAPFAVNKDLARPADEVDDSCIESGGSCDTHMCLLRIAVVRVADNESRGGNSSPGGDRFQCCRAAALEL